MWFLVLPACTLLAPADGCQLSVEETCALLGESFFFAWWLNFGIFSPFVQQRDIHFFCGLNTGSRAAAYSLASLGRGPCAEVRVCFWELGPRNSPD